jgi:hypothetical protein
LIMSSIMVGHLVLTGNVLSVGGGVLSMEARICPWGSFYRPRGRDRAVGSGGYFSYGCLADLEVPAPEVRDTDEELGRPRGIPKVDRFMVELFGQAVPFREGGPRMLERALRVVGGGYRSLGGCQLCVGRTIAVASKITVDNRCASSGSPASAQGAVQRLYALVTLSRIEDRACVDLR